jgi:hypothetical protein
MAGKILRTFLYSALIGLIMVSCSSGKKAYERGDYYNATLQAVNRLRGNPDSEKAQQALRDSYPMALKYFQDKIDYAHSANRPFKYSESVDYYELMNHMADEISRSPAALRIFPNVNFYTSELAQARNMAAEEQYNAALGFEKTDTRLSWKDAYYHFQQADCYVPGYKDVIERMRLAKFYATWKVVVEQIRVPQNYQLTSDFFLNQVIEALTSHRPNEFVEYYSPSSAKKSGIDYPDQVLRMNFDEFVIGQVYDKETMIEVSRDSVEVGSVTLPDGTVQKVYNTVKAKLTTFRRELSSQGVLDVTIIDLPVNRVVAQRKFPGQFIWFTEWSSFNGDERALSNDQLAMCNKRPVPVPRHQDLFIEFTKPIYNQLTPFLQDFYRKY